MAPPVVLLDRSVPVPPVRAHGADYEAAWRAPGTDGLAGIFTGDASYLRSPYMEPVAGLEAISRMWDREGKGPGEVFTLATQIVAVDGAMAVVRAEVRYGDPAHQEYRDLPRSAGVTGGGWCVRLGSGSTIL
jgi:ketosteroid isomerase-like protein